MTSTPRTNTTLISGIITIDPGTPDLTQQIAVANSLVNELCAPSGYDEDRLTLIETWLAAHFYHIRDRTPVSEGLGKANASFGTRLGMHLQNSEYGQTAILLDTAGVLAQNSVMSDKGLERRRLGIKSLDNRCGRGSGFRQFPS